MSNVILSFIDEFISWAHDGLMQSDEAQEYLLGRGVSQEQWIYHKLGFTIGEFDVDSLRDPSHKPEICHDRNLHYQWCDSCRYRHWASSWIAPEDGASKIQHVGRRILGSIIFPLTSYSGSSVGFQIRSIAEKKYDSFMVTRRPEGYFFGISANLSSIWSTREVMLVEGPGDHLIMERLVTPNVLGITTSSPSILQIRFLRRFVRRIILCLDLDAAGRKGVRDFYKQHGTDFDEIVDLKYPRMDSTDKDTGDYWRRVGDVAFSRYFQKVL